jgi:hypothetical protein
VLAFHASSLGEWRVVANNDVMHTDDTAIVIRFAMGAYGSSLVYSANRAFAGAFDLLQSATGRFIH